MGFVHSLALFSGSSSRSSDEILPFSPSDRKTPVNGAVARLNGGLLERPLFAEPRGVKHFERTKARFDRKGTLNHFSSDQRCNNNSIHLSTTLPFNSEIFNTHHNSQGTQNDGPPQRGLLKKPERLLFQLQHRFSVLRKVSSMKYLEMLRAIASFDAKCHYVRQLPF